MKWSLILYSTRTKCILRHIWVSHREPSYSIGSSLIESSSRSTSARYSSSMASSSRRWRPRISHRRRTSSTRSMPSWPSSWETRLTRSLMTVATSSLPMSVSSRPEATRGKLGQAHMKMLQLRIVLVISPARQYVQPSASAMVSSPMIFKTTPSMKRSLIPSWKRSERQQATMISSIYSWTTVEFIGAVLRRWRGSTSSQYGIFLTATSTMKPVKNTGPSWSSSGGRCCSRGCWSHTPIRTCYWLRRSRRPSKNPVVKVSWSILTVASASSILMPTSILRCSTGTSRRTDTFVAICCKSVEFAESIHNMEHTLGVNMIPDSHRILLATYAC